MLHTGSSVCCGWAEGEVLRDRDQPHEEVPGGGGRHPGPPGWGGREAVSAPEAQFLDEIQTKVLRVFLLVIHSHLYSFAWDFFFFKLTQPLTVSAKEKGGKPNYKIKPPSLWLRNPYRNLKSEKIMPRKPQRFCTFMNSAAGNRGRWGGGGGEHDWILGKERA